MIQMSHNLIPHKPLALHCLPFENVTLVRLSFLTNRANCVCGCSYIQYISDNGVISPKLPFCKCRNLSSFCREIQSCQKACSRLYNGFTYFTSMILFVHKCVLSFLHLLQQFITVILTRTGFSLCRSVSRTIEWTISITFLSAPIRLNSVLL